MPKQPSDCFAVLTKPRCQTCGARAEWIEQYQQEIRRLRLELAQAIAARERAERSLVKPAHELAMTHTEQAAIPVVEGSRIVEQWTVEHEVDSLPSCSSSMAYAFRNALRR